MNAQLVLIKELRFTLFEAQIIIKITALNYSND